MIPTSSCDAVGTVAYSPVMRRRRGRTACTSGWNQAWTTTTSARGTGKITNNYPRFRRSDCSGGRCRGTSRHRFALSSSSWTLVMDPSTSHLTE